jgi:4-amino-4-deoxy-L-arabinose transferase-like glycosyltransferase
MTSRINKYILTGILILGLTFRILFFIQYTSTPFYRYPLLDSRYYDESGQKIASGKLIQDRAFFMGPLYSYWIGLLYALTGRVFWVPSLAQMTLGLTTCFILYLLGARLFSPLVGLVASFLYALYKSVLFYEQTILMETLLGFLCLLLVFVILVKVDKASSGWWFVIGFLSGLAALLRGNILLIIPFLAVWIVLWDRKDPGIGTLSISLQKILFLLLGLIICILPATIHNYIAEKDFVLISSNDGINFFIGNNDKATGCYENITGVNMALDMRGSRFVEIALGRQNLKSSEISGYWRSKGIEFIKNFPLTFVKLLMLKFYYFWGRVEIDQLYSLEEMSSIMPVLSWPLVTYNLVGPLSLIGIFMILFKPEKKRTLPVLFVLGYGVSLLPFFITARYRIPIVPFLCLFAASVLVFIMDIIKKKDWIKLFWVLVVFAGLYIVMDNSRILKKRQTAEAFHNSLGIIYEKEGRLDDAVREYRKSLEYGVIPTIHSNLAHAMTMKKDYNGAIHYYREAIRLDPENPDLLCLLGEVCLFAGKTDMSILYLEKAVSLYPQINPLAYYYLAILYLKKGDKEHAIPYIKTYLRMKPDDQKARETFRSYGVRG